MVKPLLFSKTNPKGFSLVELMVALLFTLLLMMGLASVFKASLSSFYTSGENLSNTRRNRMSIDLLSDDINLACMYLADMALPPQTLVTLPPFYIIPNAPIASAGASDPQTADELYFYMDEPLPFEGTLQGASSQQTAADLVVSGLDISTNSSTYVVNCSSSEYAKQVHDGQVAILKDFWEAVYIINSATSGPTVTFNAGASPTAGITGMGASGMPTRANHIAGSGVIFVRPAQMIRYRVEMLTLDPDPEKPNGIPCLVRDQGVYSWNGSGFSPTAGSRQIITENVSGFKVYLSVNGGLGWAGLGFAGTGFDDGWNAATGIRGQIDSQLQTSGRPGHYTTRGNEHWFRDIPTQVRVDLSTRTATKRAEFSETKQELAHRELTQSLVFVPRHFGLPMR
ncbi:MAG: hypothetical protein LBQ86_00445 [Holophagales bacterium]|jgi:hypothetical protein|nr:hypothetical protein [Holophagales bacterium]